MKRLLPIFLITFSLIGCQKSHNYFPKDLALQPVELIRFDKALLNVNPQSSLEDVRILYNDYPLFMPFYVENVLGLPTTDTTYLAKQLPLFLEDTVYGFKQTNKREQYIFSDTKDIEHSLGKAFARIHYLYPEFTIPSIYLFISGFNASVLFIEDNIAIGADMYLGTDYEYYNRVVHDYQKITMRKECIPVDVVSAYLFRNLPYPFTKSRLIDNMIYRGAVMYILSQIFSDIPTYEVIGYTKEQWAWCERNERAVWNLIMDKRDLFKTESLVLTSYLNDGPFTGEISQDSPGRLGTWIGWRIAQSFMARHKSFTLQQLMLESDAERILQESFYRP